ncbi:hypothetical protein AQI88_29660 [Streptomyces cellostaticus]|uniref:Uncharacterized protein n=2 Tax=Streptomyces cellostaticus TaxID=67285 RepID=A0A101NGV9_9ACTN|nr:hypothetical protein AQI88_29660 [Streptomyces cellostaticus]
MPIKSSTNAQHARGEARHGAKYTAALRRRRTAEPAQALVLQFVTTDVTLPVHSIGAIAAAWAHAGLRVMITRMGEAHLRSVRRERLGGGQAVSPAAASPGTHSVELWRHERGREHGHLVECVYIDEPVQSLLGRVRGDFDIIVRIPPSLNTGWWRPHSTAQALLAISHTEDLPRLERRLRAGDSGRVPREVPLHPRQSAALLRERHLQAFYDCEDMPYQYNMPVHGLICCGPGDARAADPDFFDAVSADMDASHVPLLGWITAPKKLHTGHLPERDVLRDPVFLCPYTATALSTLTALQIAPRPRS